MRTPLLRLIRLYQVAVSPSLGVACRHQPTCSHYAYEAVERYGAFRGTRLALARVWRCRPGGGSGYDPVPDTEPHTAHDTHDPEVDHATATTDTTPTSELDDPLSSHQPPRPDASLH